MPASAPLVAIDISGDAKLDIGDVGDIAEEAAICGAAVTSTGAPAAVTCAACAPKDV